MRRLALGIGGRGLAAATALILGVLLAGCSHSTPHSTPIAVTKALRYTAFLKAASEPPNLCEGTAHVALDTRGGIWVARLGFIERREAQSGKPLARVTMPVDVAALAPARDGGVYVAGWVCSATLPTRHAAQPHFGGGGEDGFVARLSPTGRTLWSTYLGGGRGTNALITSGSDEATGIAVDGQGNAYVVGRTASSDFPIRHRWPQLDRHIAPYSDTWAAFLTEYSPRGTVIFSTTIRGRVDTYGTSVAVSSGGTVYVLGQTLPRSLWIGHTIQRRYGSSPGWFVIRLAPRHRRVIFRTFLGDGFGMAQSSALTVDRLGNTYVVGTSVFLDIPLRSAIPMNDPSATRDCDLSNENCNDKAVVFELSPTGRLLFSTYLGGGGHLSEATSVAVDTRGRLYVAGNTDGGLSSTNALQPSFGGRGTSDGGLCCADGFALALDPGRARLLYATYLGGAGSDIASGVAVSRRGDAFVVGETESTDFPTGKGQRREASRPRETTRVFLMRLAPPQVGVKGST